MNTYILLSVQIFALHIKYLLAEYECRLTPLLHNTVFIMYYDINFIALPKNCI